MKLSIDYKAIFKDRVVIITGVGRSGTSILGKLLGSMQPSYYLYEPAILKLVTGDDEHSGKALRAILRAILFEDYFLPLIQGRNINFNALEDSYIGNYFVNPMKEIASRWVKFPRRPDAIKLLQEEQGLFIIKMTEFALSDLPEDTFPGARTINIIRNGNDVISSSIARLWFGTDYQPIDWVAESGAPWFLTADEQIYWWDSWNSYTKAACVWRYSVERDKTGIRYEDLLERPEYYVEEWKAKFKLAKTELTDRHVESIKGYRAREYSSVLEPIQEPERSRFMALMKELGYQP